MKSYHLLLGGFWLAFACSCTSLDKNLHNISNISVPAPRVQSANPQARIGLVVANRIDWEGKEYKYQELDQIMERGLCASLGRQSVNIAPYTGSEPVDYLIEVEVVQDFSMLYIGDDVMTDFFVTLATQYATLGTKIATKWGLESSATGRLKERLASLPQELEAREKRSIEAVGGANMWSTFATGNYGVNSTLVTMLNKNAPAVSAVVERLVNSLPAGQPGPKKPSFLQQILAGDEGTKPAKPSAQPRREPAPASYRRPTDSYPEFSQLRPQG